MSIPRKYVLHGISYLVLLMMGIFLFSTESRPALGAHPASYPMGYQRLLPRGAKRLGHEDDYLPPTSAKAKYTWSYTSISQYIFMMRCLIKQEICLRGIVLK
jgi:hypothetical protein